MKKFEFQINACEQIVKSVNDNNKKIRFQAPTGSGKTYMTGLFIERILQSKFGLENPNLTFVYIAPSTGQIDYQGFLKISSYINNGFVSGFSTEYIGSTNGNSSFFLSNIDCFEKKKVYFIGWDILRAKSKIFSEGERGNIFDVVGKTHDLKTKIILIVDEAHREYPENLPSKEQSKNDSKLRKKFLEELCPDVTIEMSATMLHKRRENIDVLINAKDVRDSGAIKQEIIINDSVIVNSKDSSKEVEDKIINLIVSGVLKRNEIAESILKINSNSDWDINPLLLIQIPDKSSRMGDLDSESNYLSLIKISLEKFGFRENFDFTYWLDSKNKVFTKGQIAQKKSNIKALVFKQAIATGWDVPRACVLVKLRDPKAGSKSFEVQTLGRVLRNPFLNIFKIGGKYKLTKNDVQNLNSAFGFTNDKGWRERNSEIRDFGADVVDSQTKNFFLSEKALKNPLTINTVKIENEFDDYVDFANKIFFEKQSFIDLLISKLSSYSHEEQSDQIETSVLDGADVANNVKSEKKIISSFNFFSTSYGLFFIYSQYINTISNSVIFKEFFEFFAKKYSIKKKKLYWFIIEKFVETFSNGITLQQTMNSILGEAASRYVKFRGDKVFQLSETIDYDLEKVNLQMSEYIQSSSPDLKSTFVNSYELEFETTKKSKNLDSQIEDIFYLQLTHLSIDEKRRFHVFRNKTNVINSFYVEYFKISENRNALFFPDFIITTHSKVFIVECKGLGLNDQYKDTTPFKINALVKNRHLIVNDNKQIVIVKVGRHSVNSDLELHVYTSEDQFDIVTWNKFRLMIAE